MLNPNSQSHSAIRASSMASQYRVNSVGIIGNGVVGSAIAHTYKGFCNVRVFDVDERKTTHPYEEVIKCSDLVFLCLPTPQRTSHPNMRQPLGCNTSALDKYFELLADTTT